MDIVESLRFLAGGQSGVQSVAIGLAADLIESLRAERQKCTAAYLAAREECWSLQAELADAKKDAPDAKRYRRLRENWIDCDELQLHGRLAIIDVVVDSALSYDAAIDSEIAKGA